MELKFLHHHSKKVETSLIVDYEVIHIFIISLHFDDYELRINLMGSSSS